MGAVMFFVAKEIFAECWKKEWKTEREGGRADSDTIAEPTHPSPIFTGNQIIAQVLTLANPAFFQATWGSGPEVIGE